MIIRLILGVLILGGLIMYRNTKLKTIKLENKKSDSKVISLGYDKLSSVMLGFFSFTMFFDIISKTGNGVAANIVSLISATFIIGVIVYSTKEKIKNTVIIRENDLIIFVNGEEKFNFEDIREVSITVTDNPYVYLINITLNSGQKYEITGRDQYEMNKVVRLINGKINNQDLGVEVLAKD